MTSLLQYVSIYDKSGDKLREEGLGSRIAENGGDVIGGRSLRDHIKYRSF